MNVEMQSRQPQPGLQQHYHQSVSQLAESSRTFRTSRKAICLRFHAQEGLTAMKNFAVAAALLALVCSACTTKGTESNPYRIAVARYQQETCTFCPGGDTDVERWTRLRPPSKGDEVLEADSYIAGFVARAREYGGVELIGLESPADVFGGSSASWITEEAFDHFMDGILRDLRAAVPVDGVYLALHGAMAVRNVPRPEAEIARRVREVVGPDVTIVGTFDLHGNEDAEFLQHADMAFVVKRFPHYDSYLQGERAARMLIRTMKGEFKPTSATRKPGVITATVLQWTGASPATSPLQPASSTVGKHIGKARSLRMAPN